MTAITEAEGALRLLLVSKRSVDFIRDLDQIFSTPGRTKSLDLRPTLEEGIKAAQQNDYQVVLLDLDAPDSDAIATFEAIRTATPETPIIVICPNDRPELASACLERGATDCFLTRREQHVSSEWLQFLLQNTPQGIITCDGTGKILDVNPAAELILGFDAKTLLGHPLATSDWRVIEENGQELPPERFPAMVALRTGHPIQDTIGVLHPGTSSIRWLSVNAIPKLDDPDDAPVAVFSIFSDVTTLREATRKLEASEKLLEATGRMARVGGWTVDVKTQKVTWTTVTREIHELPEGAPPPLSEAIRFYHEEDRPRLAAAMTEALEQGTPWDLTLRLVTAKGKTLWTRSLCTPVLEKGKVTKLVGTFQDITRQKQAEEELVVSERRFRALFENSVAPILICDEAGRYLAANQAACSYLGYSKAQLLTMQVSDLITPSTVTSREQFETYRKTEEHQGEFAFLRPDGEERVALWSAAKIAPGQHASVLRDVTDIKQYQQRLHQERNRAQQFLDVAAIMLVGLDENRRITLLNPAGRQILGLKDDDDVIGEDWLRFIPEAHRAEVRNVQTTLIRDEGALHKRIESFVLNAEGTERRIVWHNAVVRDDAGNITGTISSGEDITELRALESQLAQADRLSSMGMLAAGIAHEINNPLTYVISNVYEAREELEEIQKELALVQQTSRTSDDGVLTGVSPNMQDDDVEAKLRDTRSILAAAHDGANRIREIVKNLGTFSRIEETEVSNVPLADVIRVGLDMAHNEVKYRARVVEELDRSHKIVASEGRLSQVFLNLIINAAHAMDEGQVEQNRLTVRTGADESAVWAEVHDTGTGISPELLDRIFDPFFTTKAVGVGSGLGLAISKSIVESYQGTITVKSKLGKGTTFILRFPKREEPIRKERPSLTSTGDLVRGRILIVDDEPHVRDVMKRMLRHHEVVEADSGAAAKDVLEHDSKLDLILCDMMMPDISGMELHQWLMHENEALSGRFVFVTGGAFTPRTRQYLLDHDVHRIEKPFDHHSFPRFVDDQIRTLNASSTR